MPSRENSVGMKREAVCEGPLEPARTCAKRPNRRATAVKSTIKAAMGRVRERSPGSSGSNPDAHSGRFPPARSPLDLLRRANVEFGNETGRRLCSAARFRRQRRFRSQRGAGARLASRTPRWKHQTATSWQPKSRGLPYLCTISAATFKLAASRESFCFTSSNGSRVPAPVARGETNPSCGVFSPPLGSSLLSSFLFCSPPLLSSPGSSAPASLRQVVRRRRRVKRAPARRGREGKQGLRTCSASSVMV